MSKKEEKVVEEIQSTEIKKDQPSNKIPEQKVEATVEKEGGTMKVAAKTKKVTKAKQLVQKEPTVTKVDLTKKEEEQPKEDVAKKKLKKTLLL